MNGKKEELQYTKEVQSYVQCKGRERKNNTLTGSL